MWIFKKKKASPETLSGLWMMAALGLALILSNTTTGYSEWVHRTFLWQTPFGSLPLSLIGLVKDLLMVFFFAHIGMELRGEYEEGCLADSKQILLPLMAALGGMLAPMLIYGFMNRHDPQYDAGFAIPCATDIAFALCLWNLIPHRLPASLRVFLLSIAIFDDLGAMLMIAFFYSGHFNAAWLALGVSVIGLILLFSARKYTNTWFYGLMGAALCLCFHKAGLHTTLAGFIVGALLPFKDQSGASYLGKLMHQLGPWVQWLILPLFAFVSSGVSVAGLQGSDWQHPIFLGVFLGLFLGKQLGITGIVYAMLRAGLAGLPKKSTMLQLYAVSVFAGIGFTMSLLIGMLAFEDPLLQNLVKLGVIAGSVACVLYLYGLHLLGICLGAPKRLSDTF